MPAPETINLVSPSGTTVSMPIDQVSSLIEQGYRPESGAEAAGRVGEGVRTEGLHGIGGEIAAGVGGALRGATLGLSDVALSQIGAGPMLEGAREAHPDISTGAQIAGAVAPAIIGAPTELGEGIAGPLEETTLPESIANATPAGMSARIGAKIMGLGEGSGIIGKTAAGIGAGAAEGALQNAGSYVSDVALDNKPLSAEGFVGAMGDGALWGGVAGGALSLGEGTLTAARRLFPRQEMTKAAVQAAEDDAKQTIGAALSDGEQLQTAAQNQLRTLRQQKAAMDLQLKARLDEIKVQRARELAGVDVEARRVAKGGARKAFANDATVPAAEDAAAVAGGPSTGGPPDDLMAALQGTKAKIDAGEQIGGMAARARKPARVIEDALNDAAAQGDPEMGKLVNAERALDDAKDQLTAWLQKYPGSKAKGVLAAEDFAQKFSGGQKFRYVANEESGLPTSQFNATREKFSPGAASSAERKAMAEAQDAYMSTRPTLAENVLSGKRSLDDIAGIGGGKATAREILDASNAQLATAGLQPLDEHITQALRARVADWSGDLGEAANVIGTYEKASADVSDLVGSESPPSARARAQALKEAENEQARKVAGSAAEAAAKAKPAADAIALGAAPAGNAAATPGLLRKLADLGSAGEMLSVLGVHVPSAAAIPVVGPMLSMFLKARVLSKLFRRAGSSMLPETAETVIAAKAAATRARTAAAVDKMLAGAAKGARLAKVPGPITAAVLAHSLFSPAPQADGSKSYTTVGGKAGDALDMFQRRAEEIAQSREPGAIEDAVRARVGASDPDLIGAITDTIKNKLAFLDSKLPKPPGPPGLLGDQNWQPAPSQITKFARYTFGAENPAAVFERAADGAPVSLEEMEAVQACYPASFAAAQQRVLEQASKQGLSVPYARRVQMSLLFKLPLDQSTRPDFAAFLQAPYRAPPPAPQAQAPAGTPTIKADVNASNRATISVGGATGAGG